MSAQALAVPAIALPVDSSTQDETVTQGGRLSSLSLKSRVKGLSKVPVALPRDEATAARDMFLMENALNEFGKDGYLTIVVIILVIIMIIIMVIIMVIIVVIVLGHVVIVYQVDPR